MRISIDINHPAHVHFFKNFVLKIKEIGHEVLITASDKDVACALLDNYGFEYIRLGSYGNSIFQKIANIPIMDFNMYRAVKTFRPDLFVGIASARAAHTAFLLRKRCIIFDDTEHAKEQISLYAPFVETICTPVAFSKNLGRKQIRYNGFHELAYLHPKVFTPNRGVLKELSLSDEEPFFVVRFVSWSASHDIGQKGFTSKGRRALVDLLRQHGRIIITSEKPLPEEYKPFQMSVNPAKVHDLLYYAKMYIGEGATMASEAAVLGTPSIYVNTLTLGYLNELEQKYQLVSIYSDENKALKEIENLLAAGGLKEQWRQRRKVMLQDTIDVTEWIVTFIENYTGQQRETARRDQCAG